MAKDTISLTYRALLFGGGFWQKLVHSPCQNDKHSYWLHRLNKKMESAQKKLGPIFQKFAKELGEKYGMKNDAGDLVPSGTGLPQADPKKRDEYDEMLDAFMMQSLEIEFHKLPLEYFSHIGKTPMDWDALEQVCDVSEKKLNDDEQEQKIGAQLHSLATKGH